MKQIQITCNCCGKYFKRPKGRVNEAIKLGWNSYCSATCQFTARLKGVDKICHTCGKKVWRTPKETKNSRTGRYFCDTSCAATFNNSLRIRIKKPLEICVAKNCNNLVRVRHCIYCSRKCGASAKKRTLRSLKIEVLSKIRKFHKINNRIPVKKEMYGIYRKARNAFGTWNKAIKAAGYKPNPVMFANKYVAKDGHICDSIAEMIIDNWLNLKGIPHQRSIPYPELKKMTCDFVVNQTFIEFFGLSGELKEYDRLANLKRRLSKKYNLKLVEIKPVHLFPENKLDQILNFLI